MKRCYVLGAGFSKPLGFPLAGELTELMWKSIYDREGGSDAVALRFQFVKEACECLFPGVSHPPLEALLTKLEDCAEYHDILTKAQGQKSARRAFSDFKDVIRRHLASQFCDILDQVNTEARCNVERFLKKVRAEHSCIVSLNWDCVLETVAHDCSIPLNLVSTEAEPVDGIMLSKPHGSIGIIYVPIDRRVAPVANKMLDSGELKVVHEFPGPHRFASVHDPRKLTDAVRNWSRFRDVITVAPMATKEYDNIWIRHQWEHAYNILSQAGELVCIGFSIPLTDHRPHALMRMPMLMTGQPIPVKLIDPDDSGRVHERYAECFGGALQDHFKGCWTQWLDSE